MSERKGEMDMKEKIIFFDTTLRDGEQSPGASLSVNEKVEIARQLSKLNVDVIEAGFPISSPAQFEAVKRISDESDKIISSLCRAKEDDIKCAYSAMRNAKYPRIHTFSSTSDIHILGKFGDSKYGVSLKEKRETVIKMTIDAVSFAKSLVDDVQFSAEDAGRTDIGYLVDVVEAAIEAGATTINIPDTTGYVMPEEFYQKFLELKKRVKNINKVILSVHCHNDLGLAVANTLAAVKGGARQVECTINGIGERAGNASLEEVAMALLTRKDFWSEYYHEINTKEIYNTSRMVSGLTGLIVQPNKAIVGDNAFAHESGIHQDGVLKNRMTYEIITPESVGAQRTKIVLGRHSGKHGLKVRLNELGYFPNEEELKNIYEKFLALADTKKEVFDEDLRILMGDELGVKNEFYELSYFHFVAGADTIPTATIKLKNQDSSIEQSSTGDGPVDAVFNAIDKAIGVKPVVETYMVRSVTSGRQALGEANLRIKIDEKAYYGRGASTDIVEASAKAYLQAINNYFKEKLSNEKDQENEIIEASKYETI